jgi:hypothetical protein
MHRIAELLPDGTEVPLEPFHARQAKEAGEGFFVRRKDKRIIIRTDMTQLATRVAKVSTQFVIAVVAAPAFLFGFVAAFISPKDVKELVKKVEEVWKELRPETKLVIGVGAVGVCLMAIKAEPFLMAAQLALLPAATYTGCALGIEAKQQCRQMRLGDREA